jgi:hypothetical protein
VRVFLYDEDTVPHKPPAPKTPKPPKREWQRPSVKTGHLFESNSLACGKNAPGTEECGVQHPTTS